jgi:hypothetical protein
MSIKNFLHLSAFAAFVVLAPSQGHAAETLDANLAPSPVDETNKTDLGGRGTAIATLDGDRLTVTGSFSGMPAAAVDAHLQAGDGIGVPGSALFDLTVSKAAAGTLSGAAVLTARQVDMFKSGKFYVQINSAAAGPPFGALWGWLLPPREKIDADQPQQGSWYMPPHGPGLHD